MSTLCRGTWKVTENPRPLWGRWRQRQIDHHKLIGMDLLHATLVFFHILGAAALVGGWLATFKKPSVGLFQFIGAWVQLITGVLLVGLASMGDTDVNHIKITVKLVLLIVILVAAWIGRRKVKRGQTVPTGIAHAVGGLALINVGLAVFW